MHNGVPTQCLSDLDFSRLLERMAHHTRTHLGEARARAPRLHARPARIRHELTLTSEMRSLIDANSPPPFGGISDVRPILDHATKAGSLEPEELLVVADCLRGLWLLRRFLLARADSHALLCDLGMRLPELDEIHEQVYDAFDDKGEIADDASPELFELRQRRRSLHDSLRRRVQAMLTLRGIEERLMDDYFTVREDRYVLPVRSGERGEVPGIIHGSSHTGRTLFIEPAELVPLNNELKLCEQAVRREEYRVLTALTALVAGCRADIDAALEIAGEVDSVFGRAMLAGEMAAHAPVLSEDGTYRLDQARNPILILRGVPVVPNTVELDTKTRLLVITGPNAGGKTVTLSTLGLCALMVRAGMHVPAGPDSRIPVFGKVLTVLGDSQDLQADLSTFSGHLERLKSLLAEADEQALVLLDELAVGTAPGQGAALAIAVLEALVDRGATGAVTTHFERLKTLSLEDPRFLNAAVGLDETTGAPTYRLRLGVPGSSSGLDMAERLGFDADIVARARVLLGDTRLNVERVLERLDRERAALETARMEAQQARLAHERERQQLAHERQQLQEAGEAMVRKTREEALDDLGEARKVIREVVRELQRDPTPRSVQRRRVKLAEVEARLRGQTKTPPTATSKTTARKPVEAATLAVGTTVFVPTLGREGVITALHGKRAEVLVGNLRTRVKLKDLGTAPPPTDAAKVDPQKPPRPAHRRQALEAPSTNVPPRATDNTVDVRGMRFDEAMSKVERALDDAMLRERAMVFVLHGHGTGRLKRGLREAFRSSRYVGRFQAADPDHGGDAVTLVWLR